MSRVLMVAGLIASLTLPALAEDGPMSGPYADFVPDTSLFTATTEPPDTALVRRLFTLAFTEACNAAIDGGYGGTEPETYELSYNTSYDEEGAPPVAFRLYRFNCGGGAYNFNAVYYGWDELDGLRALSFAVPSVDVVYAEGDTEGAKVEAVNLVGFEARAMLANSGFDAASGTIVGGAYWRGIGDASELGVWRFREGRFVLESYDVDASYNGEEDPVRLVDYRREGDVPAPGRPNFEEEE